MDLLWKLGNLKPATILSGWSTWSSTCRRRMPKLASCYCRGPSFTILKAWLYLHLLSPLKEYSPCWTFNGHVDQGSLESSWDHLLAPDFHVGADLSHATPWSIYLIWSVLLIIKYLIMLLSTESYHRDVLFLIFYNTSLAFSTKICDLCHKYNLVNFSITILHLCQYHTMESQFLFSIALTLAYIGFSEGENGFRGPTERFRAIQSTTECSCGPIIGKYKVRLPNQPSLLPIWGWWPWRFYSSIFSSEIWWGWLRRVRPQGWTRSTCSSNRYMSQLSTWPNAWALGVEFFLHYFLIALVAC